MLYDDINLYRELKELLSEIINNRSDTCPYCGYNTSPKYDCKNCNIDHTGNECTREGKHADNCLLEKHLALVEIDIDIIEHQSKKLTCADCKDADNPECKKAIKFDINNAKYPCESFRMQK